MFIKVRVMMNESQSFYSRSSEPNSGNYILISLFMSIIIRFNVFVLKQKSTSLQAERKE